MKTISEKIDYINTEINLTTNFNIHTKKAKQIKKKYYYLNRLQLKKLDAKILLKHNFQSEVLKLGELLEKKVLINKIISTKKIRVEKHKFAPELNKVRINKNTFDAPNLIKIDKEISVSDKLQNHKSVNLLTFLSSKSISYLNNILILN